MKKLHVIYNGWGARWQLGTLLDTGAEVLFEYSARAIEEGAQLSPLHHPLPKAGGAVTYRGERAFHGLPGFIADALPDGWGMLLMDRALRRAGRNPATVSVLERLVIVGDRAIGALSFEPAQDENPPLEALRLDDIVRHVVELQSQADVVASRSQDDAESALRQLLRLGGSPQGARPKVLVNFDPATGAVSAGGFATAGDATPWLVKFPAQGEHREVCALEELYARVARAGGLDMPQSQVFDLGARYSAFGVERFDRVVHAGVLRVPVMSLSALLQADHRLPSLDYETVLLATLRITGDQRELRKAFERCVYNVLLHNRDDHSRNFAFSMDSQGFWKLAPVFDLTFSDGPGGEHSTSVLGQGKEITRAHLTELGKRVGLDKGLVQACIDQALNAARRWTEEVRGLPIRKSSLKLLAVTIKRVSDAMA